MKLEVLIGVDNEEPRLAVGSCSRTLLENLGYDPIIFRESGHIVTSWKWVTNHDGPVHSTSISKKPGKRIGRKTATKLESRLEAWNRL